MEIETNQNEDVTVTQTSFVVNKQQRVEDDVEEEEEEDDEEEEEEEEEEGGSNVSIEEMELPENVFRSRHHELLNSLVDEDDGEDYGDIQFFHHHSQIQQHLQQQHFQQQQQQQQHQHQQQLQQQQAGNGNTDYEGIDVSNQLQENSDYINSSSENPFTFPSDMENQFFPGIQNTCVGYLETIMETDEEYEEEEEGCSGQNWWTANSDTDTESVIRLDNNISCSSGSQSSHQQQQPQSLNIICNPAAVRSNGSNNSSNNNNNNNNANAAHGRNEMPSDRIIMGSETGSENEKSTFRTTASSRPFEMEDLHLLDQLDFNFEESFGSGMKSHPQNHHQKMMSLAASSLNESPLFSKITTTTITANNATVFANLSTSFKDHDMEEKSLTIIARKTSTSDPEHDSSDPDEEEVQPAEVNEEDFFYTTSEDSEEGSTEETSSATSSDNEDGAGGSGGCGNGKKDGVVVLAEFSLNSNFNNAVSNRYRRSFEGNCNKSLRSFRSFDSLNSLAGTELLFSKGDTFPSFHYIKEVAEPSSSTSPTGCGEVEGGVGVGVSGVVNVGMVGMVGSRDRKNSDSSAEQMSTGERQTEMSTENLSEDSGIGADGSGGSGLNLNLNSSSSPQLSTFKSSTVNNPPGVVQPSTNTNSNTTSNCHSSANNINPHHHHNNNVHSEPNSLSYISKSEFALNPFVYSSASEENSMNSTSLFHLQTDSSEKRDSSLNNQFTNNYSIDTNSNSKAEDNNVFSISKVQNETSTSTTHQVYDSSNSNSLADMELLLSGGGTMISNVKPDVLAQCNTNKNNTNNIMLADKSTRERSSGSGVNSSTSSDDDDDGDNNNIVEPQVIPPQIIIKRHIQDNNINPEGLMATPFVHMVSGGDKNFPAPHSEVLLKFVDEDKTMECDVMSSMSESDFGRNNMASVPEEDEDEYEEEEEEGDEEQGDKEEKVQVKDNNNDDVHGVDGANNVDREKGVVAAAHMLIESDSHISGVCECNSNDNNGSSIRRRRGMEVESGPMSALSCTCVCISSTNTTTISADTQSNTVHAAHVAAAPLTPMTMGSPSLAQNNNSTSTVLPSPASALASSSLLLESELPATTTQAPTSHSAASHSHNSNDNNADSVCVQKSSGKDVVHHESRLVETHTHSTASTTTHHHSSPHHYCYSPSAEEFISGSSNFGTTRNTEGIPSVEGNLDILVQSKSLAEAPTLTEHLCDSSNSIHDQNQEEIINKTHHPITDNGIFTSPILTNITNSVVIEKSNSERLLGSDHHHSLASPSDDVLQGAQCTNESPHLVNVPDFTTFHHNNTNINHNNFNLSDNNIKSDLDNPHPQSSSSSSSSPTMDVVELRRSRSPPSTASTPTPTNIQQQHQQPIKTKTYGPRNEVEVYLLSSRTPSPIMKPNSNTSVSGANNTNEDMSSSALSGIHHHSSLNHKDNKMARNVHFSPVVSEISWRESYTDQGSEVSGSSDNLLDDQESSVDGHIIHSGGHFDNMNVKQSVTVSEQLTQPIESVVLLPHNIHHNNMLDGDNNSGGHEYEDVGGGDSSGDLRPVSPQQSLNKNHHHHHQSNKLSMVPDLLSQCENASQSHTHITVNIEEKSLPPPQQQQQLQSTFVPPSHQQQQQHQIFPSIFADKTEGKSSGKVSKSKKSSAKSFNIPLGSSGGGGGSTTSTTTVEKTTTSGSSKKEKEKLSSKDKENKEQKWKDDEAISKENKASKPGFFERLSKIRLSGGSKNKNKKKIHPSDKENHASSTTTTSTTNVTLTSDDSTSRITSKNTTTTISPHGSVKGKSPILKKYPANTPTPVNSQSQIQNYEHDNSKGKDEVEAFQHILDDIAGINVIKMRQQQQSGRGGVSSNNSLRASSPTSQNQDQTSNNDGGSSSTPTSSSSSKLRSFADKRQFFVESPVSEHQGRGGSPLDTKLSQFKEEISEVREVISKSHPDLEVIEGVVRDTVSSSSSPHHFSSRGNSPHPPFSASSSSSSPPPPKTNRTNTTQSSPDIYEQKTEREWYKLLKSAAEKYYYRGEKDKDKDKEKKVKTAVVVETDLDTVDSELVLNKVPSSSSPSSATTVKTRSLTNLSTSKPLSLPLNDHLGHEDLDHPNPLHGDLSDSEERAKSMEFLLDDNNKSSSVPPENQLRLENRQLSHHELRIQRSLASLNVPEWYKKSAVSSANPDDGLLNKNTATTKSSGSVVKLGNRSPYGSSGRLAGGWPGLSKNPSLSSLQNNARYAGSLNRTNQYFVRGRPATRSSRESLMSPSSTASQSPSAFERCSFTYGMPFSLTRFNNGRLSVGSASISPPSTPGTAAAPTYVKKPYLGWRSQERLNAAAAGNTTTPSSAPLRLSMYRPPAERLAAEVLSNRNRLPPSERPPLPKPPPRAEKTVLTNKNPQLVPANSSPPPSNNVHESIREVTQQINQFVHHGENGGPEQRQKISSVEEPPKPKPRQRQAAKKTNVWMESSFVGTKPTSIE